MSLVDFDNLSLDIAAAVHRLPTSSPQRPPSPVTTLSPPTSPLPLHPPTPTPLVSPGNHSGIRANGSMYGRSFAEENETKKYNLRRHLLKTYIVRLGAEDDEISRLINSVMDVDRIDCMSDDDIKQAMKLINTAQGILEDGSEYNMMIQMLSLFMDRLEQVFGKRYPDRKHISTIIAYNFKQTINRVQQMKNKYMDKLVAIASTDFDKDHSTKSPSLSHVIARGLTMAAVQAGVFGLLEYIDSKCNTCDDPLSPLSRHLFRRGDRENISPLHGKRDIDEDDTEDDTGNKRRRLLQRPEDEDEGYYTEDTEEEEAEVDVVG